ncbi:MAG: 6-phosphofructokinase [Sedimentisphaerales bacterium]|nr:6-phosphofructokinase [Sedimentisphaerales bacterium]
MVKESKTRCIGILTSGGDCPGLNAAIRAITKTAINVYGMTVLGFMDGFRGLVENRIIHLENNTVSGILTNGGTILGTSRDKLHKMPMGNKIIDMTDVAIENLRQNHIDCLVCLGGNGTQKNALRLHQAGNVNVLTLPKTIDNDVAGTEITFGYDTAMQIATDAIDRLHTTATSHHRIIVCEIMGNKSGWLTLGAGVAGGADVILIPEIPYDISVVVNYLLERRRKGSRFSIIAIAEGAVSIDDENKKAKIQKKAKVKSKKQNDSSDTTENNNDEIAVSSHNIFEESKASIIAKQLQKLTGIEARVTSLGHIQRGGVPSAFDRTLCTLLGTKAAELLASGIYNVMVSYKADSCIPVPLEKIAGIHKTVPLDHPLIISARLVGTCLGNK